jgi:hypothetical protein
VEAKKYRSQLAEAMKLDVLDRGLRVNYVPDSDALAQCFAYGQKIGEAVVG